MTREIRLHNGMSALVDDDDYELVSHYAWRAERDARWPNSTFYAVARVRSARLWMHRLVMGAGPNDPIVDHRNGDGLDNRRSVNLRLASELENARNKRRRAGKAFKGICFRQRKNKPSRPWVANIGVRGRTRCLGFFASEIEAARAYDVAAQQEFGEFASLNFSPGRDWLFPSEHVGIWPVRPD